MKRLVSGIAVTLAAIACAFGLTACGSQSMKTIDMGDYTFDVPAAWSDIQETYPGMEMYWIGDDEDNPDLTIYRSSLDPERGQTPADAMQEIVDMWFRDGGAATHTKVVDSTIAGLPARSALVTYNEYGGRKSAVYMILFSPDAKDYVDMQIKLTTPTDSDGLKTAEAIRDSIEAV